MSRPKPEITTYCETCFKEIPSWRKYCSLRCYYIGRKNNTPRRAIECNHCHKVFSLTMDKIKNGIIHFCSRECYRLSTWLKSRGRILGRKYIAGVFDKIKKTTEIVSKNIAVNIYNIIPWSTEKRNITFASEDRDSSSTIWGLQEEFG